MNFYKNNYFQSQQYKSLNKNIFNNKIIEINKKNFFILRSRINNKLKLDFSKKSLGTEFKGILEFIGQPVDLRSQNFDDKLLGFFDSSSKIIKNYNPGIIIFRAVDMENKETFEKASNLFLRYGYKCRPWKSLIINLNETNKDLLISHYNTRREVGLIKNLNLKIEPIVSFDDYLIFIDYFFQSFGHENYPNKDDYFNIETFNNLIENHNFFIIKIDNIPYSIFSVRIFNDRAYWCMVGRIKRFKYSLHAYSISYLFDYLKEKKINYLDLAGFNPNPKTIKENGIKKFTEKFEGKTTYQPTFIFDNTNYIKILRSITNYFKKNKTLADKNFF